MDLEKHNEELDGLSVFFSIVWVEYDSEFRLIYTNYVENKQIQSAVKIDYCPICGERLLSERWMKMRCPNCLHYIEDHFIRDDNSYLNEDSYYVSCNIEPSISYKHHCICIMKLVMNRPMANMFVKYGKIDRKGRIHVLSERWMRWLLEKE